MVVPGSNFQCLTSQPSLSSISINIASFIVRLWILFCQDIPPVTGGEVRVHLSMIPDFGIWYPRLSRREYTAVKSGHKCMLLWASQVALVVKNHLQTQEMQKMRVRSLGGEDSLEEGTATHSTVLVWRSPWMEEPGRLQSMGLPRVRHNCRDLARTHVGYTNSLQPKSLSPALWYFPSTAWTRGSHSP